MKKLLAILVVLGAIAAFVAVRYPSVIADIINGAPDPVATRVEGAPDIMLPDNATYRQDHIDWATDRMGQTSDTLADYGCTVTSVANAITNVTGQQMSPKTLNDSLSQIDGYTKHGWLIWNKIAQTTNGAASVKVYDAPTHEAIEACMADGSYPIVKIKLGGVIPHWVMLVGRKDGEYIMRDPLVGSPSDRAIPVSFRSNKIHSLRCLSGA